MTPLHDELRNELADNLDLTPEDLNRAVFTLLAYGRGWSKARIGRLLGVSRARVHQRIERYQRYAQDEPERWPVVRDILERSPGAIAEHWFNPELTTGHWADPDFANRMIGFVTPGGPADYIEQVSGNA